jgi:hypothetical protein
MPMPSHVYQGRPTFSQAPVHQTQPPAPTPYYQPPQPQYQPPAVVETPRVDYRSSPRYIELQTQENSLKGELASLRTNLENNKAKAQTTANLVMKARFEKAIARLAEQVTEKEQQLNQVQQAMAQMAHS